jgi:hypothetical protein
VRKETILTIRRIKREERQMVCKEGITSVIIKGERTGNLLFKCPRAESTHHSGRNRPNNTDNQLDAALTVY